LFFSANTIQQAKPTRNLNEGEIVRGLCPGKKGNATPTRLTSWKKNLHVVHLLLKESLIEVSENGTKNIII